MYGSVNVPGAKATPFTDGLMSAPDYVLLHSLVDTVKLAYHNALPSNALIADADNASALGAYVECTPLKLSDLLTSVDSSLDMVHPAFMVGGQQVSHLYVGKYQASSKGTRLYSLNGHDPVNTINLNNITQYAINKGGRHHEITASEWALRALMAKKRGTTPKGNNNYGRDISEALPGGVPTYVDDLGKTCRVATGTGPITWSDTGDTTGVWDMNGNVLEWIIGVRLVKGELQMIPWNN
ncbi:MAG: hypothetical protein IJT94_04660, partial [Oscillibacter sp.]|nr:hypothetical protein [Oscillibacter sp.]